MDEELTIRWPKEKEQNKIDRKLKIEQYEQPMMHMGKCCNQTFYHVRDHISSTNQSVTILINIEVIKCQHQCTEGILIFFVDLSAL